MKKKYLSTFCVCALVLVLNGCASSWYWPEGQPEHLGWRDVTANGRVFSTFTIVPYSALKNDSQLKPEEENAMMFSLMNQMEERGYRYVSQMDSADFIVTEDINTRYTKGEDFSLEFPNRPTLHATRSFTPQTFGFGTYYDVPMPTPWHPQLNRAHTKLNVIVYDGRSHSPIHQWVEGVVSADTSFIVAAQNLIVDFSQSLDSVAMPMGAGETGFLSRIWTYDLQNFWPIVGRPSAAAKQVGLKEMDVLLTMDGKSLKNIDAAEFRQRINCEPGRTFDFRVWHKDGHVSDVRITSVRRGKGE